MTAAPADLRPAAPTAARRATFGCGLVLLALHLLAARPSISPPPDSVDPALAPLRLDPNVATRDELMLLPGIGPTLADRIIDYRESARPRPAFRSADDLERVHRIGPRTVELLRPFVAIPQGSAGDRSAGADRP